MNTNAQLQTSVKEETKWSRGISKASFVIDPLFPGV
jgi:hypothetical protein